MVTDNENILFLYLKSFGTCFLLFISYIVSLYVWKSQYHRNHPETIKQRFISVFIITVISPLFVYFYTPSDVLSRISILELIGFKIKGIIPAISLPLILTAILYLGPIISFLSKEKPPEAAGTIPKTDETETLLVTLRNLLVAPFSEEFAFRACMIPILLQAFSPFNSVMLSASLFGLAHIHHLYEYITGGVPIKTAILVTSAQCIYTMLFGAYAGYIFVSTGHILSAIIMHSFCNYMGFPNIAELADYNKSIRGLVVTVMYFVGLISWIILLKPLTNPVHFSNNLLQKLATDSY